MAGATPKSLVQKELAWNRPTGKGTGDSSLSKGMIRGL